MRRILFGAVALSLLAAAPAPAQDQEGCKDHPLFTRMPNTHIADCQSSQFDLRAFPFGPGNNDPPTKSMQVEGPVQYISYELNDGAAKPSGLQIMRNFENAATRGGGTVEGRYPGWCNASYDNEHMPRMGNGCMSYALTMKFLKGGQEIWVFLQADENEGNYMLTISEREAMKQDISVNEVADKLNKDGFVALYVTFETGKATILSDAAATLDAAAGALKAAGEFKVEVAGHTDDVGTPEANLTLSQQRAQSVVAALVQRGIPAARLVAKGYGQTTPIADNRTEGGRAKNRRVELVKK
ncbi:MAG: OmpA family protein [Gemmatimonadaceae bacterium]|nr:OmpA family protein [Gemmatimonadaceae bacterium]